MRGSKAKKIRRMLWGKGYYWPTVKADKRARKLYRQLKKAVQRKTVLATIDRGGTWRNGSLH